VAGNKICDLSLLCKMRVSWQEEDAEEGLVKTGGSKKRDDVLYTIFFYGI